VPERRNLLVVLPGAGQPPETAKPTGPAAPAASPQVEHVELPGGGKLLLFERHDDPIVAVSAVFLGGVRFEPEGRNGVSDLMAAMLTRGAAGRSAEQLAERLEACGGSLSGYGGRNSFGVSAKFLSKDLPLALELVNEVLAAPAFADDEFQKLRGRVLARIRRRAEDIEELHSLLQEKAVYSPHPYSRSAEGTAESVGALKREDLVDFHRRFCRPDNMVLCVAGDFRAEDVRRLVPEKLAEFLKPRAEKLALPAVPAVPAIAGEQRREQAMPGAKQALLSLAFRGVDTRNPDRFALEVMRGVLSGMGGRLFGELRDKQSLAYSVGAYLEMGVDPGAAVFYIATEADKLDAALAGIKAQVAAIRDAPVTAEELARSRNALVGAEARRGQSLSGTAQDMAYNQLYGLGAEASLRRIREIEKVSAEDVQAVARRYLDPANCVIVVTRPAPAEGRKPGG